MNQIRSKCVQYLVQLVSSMGNVLHGSPSDTEVILKKVITALPERYFTENAELEKLSCFIAKQYVLFACQEGIANEMYVYHLINFIENCITDYDALCTERDQP